MIQRNYYVYKNEGIWQIHQWDHYRMTNNNEFINYTFEHQNSIRKILPDKRYSITGIFSILFISDYIRKPLQPVNNSDSWTHQPI